MISKDPLISELEGLENLISEEDSTSVRSLYTRLKHIFTDDIENTSGNEDERIDYSNKPSWW